MNGATTGLSKSEERPVQRAWRRGLIRSQERTRTERGDEVVSPVNREITRRDREDEVVWSEKQSE